MGVIDVAIYVAIAIMYNIFVHNLASLTYKDLQYNEKHQNTSIMLILFGGIGILVAKIMAEHKSSKNSPVVNGLYYGGIVLALTSVVANWDEITGEVKLIAIGATLGLLIWYGKKREKTTK